MQAKSYFKNILQNIPMERKVLIFHWTTIPCAPFLPHPPLSLSSLCPRHSTARENASPQAYDIALTNENEQSTEMCPCDGACMIVRLLENLNHLRYYFHESQESCSLLEMGTFPFLVRLRHGRTVGGLSQIKCVKIFSQWR